MISKSNKSIHLKFTKDIFWVALAQFCIYLLGFFTLPVLTKSFGAEQYGLWSQIIVTVGLLNPILTLHLGTAVVRYLAAEKKTYNIRKSFSNIFFLVLLFDLFLILLIFFFKTDISIILFQNDNFGFFVILTIIWASSGALFAILISYLRAKGEIRDLSLINIVCNLFKFVFIVLLVSFGFLIQTIILFQILVESIFIIFLFILIFLKIGFVWPDFKNSRKYLSFSVPQIPSGALLWIVDSSDRYLITSFLGLTQTGIYSASYSIGSLITMFYIPISFAIFPLLSKLWVDNELIKVKKYMEYSTKFFLFLSVPASFGLLILSKPLLGILTTSEFEVGGGILTFLIALSILFLGIYQINLYIIYLNEKTKILPIIIGISASINLIINVLLIPFIGIIGAAVSTLFSYFLLAVIVLLWAKKEVRFQFDYIFLIKIVLASIIMSFVLKYIPISTIFEIFFSVLLGTLIYLIIVYVLKIFSIEEKKIIKEAFKGFIYKLKQFR